jgi:hypothetical protein
MPYDAGRCIFSPSESIHEMALQVCSADWLITPQGGRQYSKHHEEGTRIR